MLFFVRWNCRRNANSEEIPKTTEPSVMVFEGNLQFDVILRESTGTWSFRVFEGRETFSVLNCASFADVSIYMKLSACLMQMSLVPLNLLR